MPKIKLTRLHRIARGGVARLTLAVQPDGTRLVIRELHPHLVFKFRVHWRFVNGTRVREMLTPHARIVYSVERGYYRFTPYEVIEYVPGENLRERIIHKDPVARKNHLLILRQAAEALAYMHSQDIMHLDVKPENFLVDDSGPEISVKLTDFDLSRICKRPKKDPHRAGTGSYMAPEQFKTGTIGPQADIFAFGVMAYYLVTGQKPFSGFTITEMRRQQVSTKFKIPEPSRLNPDISPKLERLIMQCLEKDPDQRIPSMLYLQQELGRV